MADNAPEKPSRRQYARKEEVDALREELAAWRKQAEQSTHSQTIPDTTPETPETPETPARTSTEAAAVQVIPVTAETREVDEHDADAQTPDNPETPAETPAVPVKRGAYGWWMQTKHR